jgi:hypothetical protein
MLEVWERRVAREDLIATLGSVYASGFTDSSETDFQQYLDWGCGCSAHKSGFVDRLWRYEPCVTHDDHAPAGSAQS